MPVDLNTILSAPGTPPPEVAAPPSDEAPAKGVDPVSALETLPADVLDVPAVFAVAKGNPPAISAPSKSADPAIKTLTKNAQALVAAGFGLYESRDGKTRVLYNSAKVDIGNLLDADVQGKLMDVAPDFSTVKTAAPQNGGTPQASAAPPATPASGPAQQPESQPAPAVQTKLATKRVNNTKIGSPTSGPKPGAGRILNEILQPAI